MLVSVLTSDSGKPRVFRVQRAGRAPWKRLQIRRMKLDAMMDKSRLESEPSITVSSALYCFEEVPLDGPTAGDAKSLKVVEVTRSVAPEMLLSELDSSQSSPEGSNSPSEVVVAGEEERDEGEANSGTYISHGVVSVMGRRRAMEDAVTVVPGIVPGELSFFAVYDGHGGAKVANACRDKLHEFLLKELKIPKGNNKEEGIEWGKVMMACFKKMDEEVSGCGSEEPEVAVGSTAAVVMVGKEVVVVANCGDSRVVLGRGGDAVPLSRDHRVVNE